MRCSHGNQFRDFLYVDDCVDAFVALLDSPIEGPVNIASGHPVTIKDVVRMIVTLIPGSDAVPIEFGDVPSPPEDPPLLVGDVRRLSDELGWAPRSSLREGLVRTIGSWSARDDRNGGK